MTNPNFFYFNAQTGESVEREMTDEETQQAAQDAPISQETPTE